MAILCLSLLHRFLTVFVQNDDPRGTTVDCMRTPLLGSFNILLKKPIPETCAQALTAHLDDPTHSLSHSSKNDALASAMLIHLSFSRG